MVKRTGPTNWQLKKLISFLKDKDESVWGKVAQDLSKPTRERRTVNLSNISRNTEKGDKVIVPGKILSDGYLDHSLTVAAFSISDKAREKLEESGSDFLGIKEFVKDNPKGEEVKVIG